MEQQYQAQGDSTVFEEMKQVFEPVFAMEEKLRALEHDMSEASEIELKRMGETYARLNDAFEKACEVTIEFASRILNN